MAKALLALSLALLTLLVESQELGVHPKVVQRTNQLYGGSEPLPLTSLTTGLSRRQTSCGAPWFSCKSLDRCCAPFQICQPNNHMQGTNGWCCDASNLQCGGLACCQPDLGFCCGSRCCPHGDTCFDGRCSSDPPPTPTSTTGSPTTPSPTPSLDPTPMLQLDYDQLVSGSKELSDGFQSQRQRAIAKLLEGICKGLGSANVTLLAFDGDAATQTSNRLKSGCASRPCLGNADSACMQFPFASTIDAGSGSNWTCVPPLTQYIQGAILSGFRSHSGIASGQRFQIGLSGFSCVTLRPDHDTPTRRDLSPGGSQTGQVESFPPFMTYDSRRTVIVGLGDLAAGSCVINTDIKSGNIGDLRVLDAEGNRYGDTNDAYPVSSGQHTVNITIPDDAVGLGYFMSTSDTTVDLTSTMQTSYSNSASQMWSRHLMTLIPPTAFFFIAHFL